MFFSLKKPLKSKTTIPYFILGVGAKMRNRYFDHRVNWRECEEVQRKISTAAEEPDSRIGCGKNSTVLNFCSWMHLESNQTLRI